MLLGTAAMVAVIAVVSLGTTHIRATAGLVCWIFPMYAFLP